MDEMRSKIVDLLKKNPRTIKELSIVFGLSKLEVLNYLKNCNAIEDKKMLFNGRVRPVAISYYRL